MAQRSAVPPCELKEVKDENPIKVTPSWVSQGCWSADTSEGREIHLINLNLDMISWLIRSDSWITVTGPDNTVDLDLPAVVQSDSNSLLGWAKSKFGAVTSFTELIDPQSITFNAGRGHSQDCELQTNFTQGKYLEYLPVTMSVEVKFCRILMPLKAKEEVHIIRHLPVDTMTPRLIEVNFTHHNPSTLILQGPNTTTWKIICRIDCKFKSNNPFIIMGHLLLPNSPNLPASYEGLLKFAEADSNTAPASYTEISTDSKRLKVYMKSMTNTAPQLPSTSLQTTTSPNKPKTTMHLYLSPDYRSPSEGIVEVLSNKTVYAEVSTSLSMEGAKLDIENCSLHARALGMEVKSLDIKKETCNPKTCSNRRFSFTLKPVQEHHSQRWDLQCFTAVTFVPHLVSILTGLVHSYIQFPRLLGQPQLPCRQGMMSVAVAMMRGQELTLRKECMLTLSLQSEMMSLWGFIVSLAWTTASPN
ncbi:UNVERIFIED_CONTAM: hypothetical protein FKN15_061711 [Acipenser sinensis]